jgi:hypothetical protein
MRDDAAEARAQLEQLLVAFNEPHEGIARRASRISEGPERRVMLLLSWLIRALAVW